MRNGHVGFAITLVAMLTATARADPLQLGEAVERAQAQSPSARVAQARVEQGSGQKTIASYLLPSNPRLTIGTVTDRAFQNQGEGSVDLGLEQELELFGQRGLRIAVSDAELAGLRLELEMARSRVRNEVEVAYLDLMYQERRVAALTSIAEQAARIEEAARRRTAAGDIASAEHTLITADLASARADAGIAEADRQAARARVAVLVGRPAADPLETTGIPPTLPVAEPLEAWLATARQRRFDLRARAAYITAGEDEIALRKRERLPNPTLAIGYSRSRSVFAPGAISDTDQLVTASISIPIPLFRTGRGEIVQARGRRAEAEAERDGLRASIDIEVAAGHARYQEARQRATELGAVEAALSITLAQYETAYNAGKIDLPTFLAIRDRVLRAQIAAIAARHDAAVADAQLRFVAGGTPGAS